MKLVEDKVIVHERLL